jgi:hypothetical protein
MSPLDTFPATGRHQLTACSWPGGVSISDLRAAACSSRPTLPESKPPKSLLRAAGVAASVSFADQTEAAPPPPPRLPPPPSAYYGAVPPAYPYGSWPPFLPPSVFPARALPPERQLTGRVSSTPLASTTAHPSSTPASSGATGKLRGKAKERQAQGLSFCAQPIQHVLSGE